MFMIRLTWLGASVEKFHVALRLADASHGLIPRDTQLEPWSVRELLARRGHQRCHCNEEGFGTLSRQLANMMKATAVPVRA
jgi:hypothetical protein